jgi:hypothetical protein
MSVHVGPRGVGMAPSAVGTRRREGIGSFILADCSVLKKKRWRRNCYLRHSNAETFHV